MTAPCVLITDLKSTQVQELIANLGKHYRQAHTNHTPAETRGTRDIPV